MAETGEDMVRAVCEAWGQGVEPGQAALRRYFSEDCRWDQGPISGRGLAGFATTVGPEEAAQSIGGIPQMGFTSIQVEMRNVAEAGGVVFTERVDWLIRPDGSRVGPWLVVGVTEVSEGKITAWRDYFDGRDMTMLTGE